MASCQHTCTTYAAASAAAGVLHSRHGRHYIRRKKQTLKDKLV